jgi:YebC/PmpR family DNA-binding regulatory protein
MAGHSPFKNIMHRKKAVDAKRSRAFSKHARLIMSAVRTGGGDPATNLTLRYAIDRSREDNMTNEAIERAIKSALGKADAGALETLTYEGYGPGGVALLIDALTDNRARTFGDVRLAVEHNGGTVGATGSVAWNFERRGLFFVAAPAEREEALLEVAMAAEADDCSPGEGGFGITADPTRFAQVKQALVDAGFKPGKSEIAWVPKATVTLKDEQVAQLSRLIEALEELDDVQGVATNLEWTDAALAAADKA